jgi:hypothetical protein
MVIVVGSAFASGSTPGTEDKLLMKYSYFAHSILMIEC